MKKSLSLVALLAIGVTLTACGGKSKSGETALATIESVGNAMESAQKSAQSRSANRGLNLADELAFAVNSTPVSDDTVDFSDPNGDFELKFKTTATGQSSGGISFHFAPKSEKMKSTLDVEYLDVSTKVSVSEGSGRGPSESAAIELILSGKTKSAGTFSIGQSVDVKMEGNTPSMTVKLTVEAGGEKAEIVAKASGNKEPVVTLNGSEMTEAQAEKLQASLQKISNSMQSLQTAFAGYNGQGSSPSTPTHPQQPPTSGYPNGGYSGYPGDDGEN